MPDTRRWYRTKFATSFRTERVASGVGSLAWAKMYSEMRTFNKTKEEVLERWETGTKRQRDLAKIIRKTTL